VKPLVTRLEGTSLGEVGRNGHGVEQVFHVRILWSPDSDVRLTESDIQEAIEGMALELDDESSVEVRELISDF